MAPVSDARAEQPHSATADALREEMVRARSGAEIDSLANGVRATSVVNAGASRPDS